MAGCIGGNSGYVGDDIGGGEALSLAETLRSVASHCSDMGVFGGRHCLSRDQFQRELSELGLVGRRFGVDECVRAVEEARHISIDLEMMPDAGIEDWSEELAYGGNLAEICYSPTSGRAVLVFRESLLGAPWPAYELAVFHELAHLIGRHHLAAESLPGGAGVKRMEEEAERRAKWLLLAGLYPESFSQEAPDRVA